MPLVPNDVQPYGAGRNAETCTDHDMQNLRGLIKPSEEDQLLDDDDENNDNSNDAGSEVSDEWQGPKRRADSHLRSADPSKKRKIPEPGLLEPHWFPEKMRAASPACSVQSDSVDSSSGRSGTRPATFLYTLCSFLANNPKSQYMRWTEDGSYFIIPDKEGLMDTVISGLFNQKSYASFARQLNIYGWRRLQTSPDGKTTNATHTMWKHDDIYRDCPEENLRNVKRNATDKSRRNSKNIEDTEEVDAAARARQSLVSTTVAHALATRPRSVSTLSNGGHFSLTVKAPRPPLLQDTVPMRPVAGPGHSGYSASQRINAPSSVRPTRPLPARPRAPTMNLADSAAALTLQERRMRDARLRSSRSESPPGSAVTREEETPAMRHARHFSDILQPRSRIPEVSPVVPATERLSRSSHRRNNSSLGTFATLPSRPVPRQQTTSENPVDVYIASTKEEKASPVIIARDRLDVTVWTDDSAQSRFVLAGDLLRSWVIWDIFPSSVLLYVQSADTLRPPRPIGVPGQLRDNVRNGDPEAAVSRERIYLEIPSEPGAVGQCCLVFRALMSQATPTTADTENHAMGEANTASSVAHEAIERAASSSNARQAQQAVSSRFAGFSTAPQAMSPIFPASPRVSGPPPVSSERRGPARAVSKSGHILQQHSISSTLSSDSSHSELKTPRTADAVSSLALMQSLSRKTALGMPPFDEGYADVEDLTRFGKSIEEDSYAMEERVKTTTKANSEELTSTLDELKKRENGGSPENGREVEIA